MFNRFDKIRYSICVLAAMTTAACGGAMSEFGVAETSPMADCVISACGSSAAEPGSPTETGAVKRPVRVIDGPGAAVAQPSDPKLASLPGAFDTRIGLGVNETGQPRLTKDGNAQYVYWNPSHKNARDTNSGLDPEYPKATLKSAWGALRDGYGDWLLMAQGSKHLEGFGFLVPRSGKSAQYPLVVTTYDPNDPRNANAMRQGYVTLATNPTDSLLDIGDPRSANRAVFENIIFDKPARGSFSVLGLGPVQKDLMFFNVKFLRTHVAFQGDYQSPFPVTRMSNLIFRKCVFAFAYMPGSEHAQGLFLSTTSGVTIEDSIFYHNGWAGSNRTVPGSTDQGQLPDIFKHGAYLTTLTDDTIFRRNVVADSSSHGVQFRGGGTISDNVFINNPVNVLIGGGDDYNIYRPGGVPYSFTNNVIIGSSDIDPSNPRGFGVSFENTRSNGLASGNIVANVGTLSKGNQFGLTAAARFNQPTYLNWTNNIQYNWGKSTLTAFLQDKGNNKFPGQVFLSRAANIIDSEVVPGNLTKPGSPFPDPTRTLTTYAASNGFASDAALWEYVLQNSQLNWSRSIGDYIRAGFGK